MKNVESGKLPAGSLWGRKAGDKGWRGERMKGTKGREKKGKDTLGRRNLREQGRKNHWGLLGTGRRLRKPQRRGMGRKRNKDPYALFFPLKATKHKGIKDQTSS